ncbi:MAG: phosphoribosylaminoimidazolesuccinocarboxamide synthase [Acidobacteriota bacterium]|nr:phosphoribosylaminoimidazolesuccinocarboxamide synthase [Acidobacteriota bacterium]
MNEILWHTDLPGLAPPRRGKVRDVYDLSETGAGERLLIVASDRLSAYDHVLRPGIPDKGKILTQLSNFWFRRLEEVMPNHLLATSLDAVALGELAPELAGSAEQLRGRTILTRKAEVVPFECVARGYLAGSGYREYVAGGSVCGIPLPDGLERASRLPEPIFTPATKAEEGHDENVDFDTMAAAVGEELAVRLRDLTLELYRRAADHAAQCGLLLADTKFEFGLVDDELLLVDEVLTSDSSRYWLADQWRPGAEPVSVDKQYVRNWLDSTGWDHESPPPVLTDEVVAGTRDRYLDAYRRLTGSEPEL